MRRDGVTLVNALASAIITIANGIIAWTVTQPTSLVWQAFEDINVTFFFWMMVLLVMVSATVTVLLFVIWWIGKPTPNEGHGQVVGGER